METHHKKVGEDFEIILDNRGSSGLSLLYETDNHEVVRIEKIEHRQPENSKPGDPIKIVFKIHPQKKGTVNVLFYETQVWNKNFQHIPVKEMMITVE